MIVDSRRSRQGGFLDRLCERVPVKEEDAQAAKRGEIRALALQVAQLQEAVERSEPNRPRSDTIAVDSSRTASTA